VLEEITTAVSVESSACVDTLEWQRTTESSLLYFHRSTRLWRRERTRTCSRIHANCSFSPPSPLL